MMYNDIYFPERYGAGLSHGLGFGPGWFLATALFGGLFIVIVLLSLALKGFALWNAAKRDEKWWFIALLFINTLGILELIYLIFFAKVLFNKNCCGKKCGDACCEGVKTEKSTTTEEGK